MESDRSKHTEHAFVQTIQKLLSSADQEYLSKHTSIPKLLNEYLISLAETRPTDVDAFTKAFFASFKVEKSSLITTPLVIIGPSGCGKETLHKRLRRQYPHHFAFSVSYTTRSPRPGEVDGVNYFFVTSEQFQARIDSGDFLEHVTFSGNQYGTSKSYLELLAKQGRICIIEVDIQGAKKLREAGFKANNIFIKSPSIEELRTRLTKRGTETQEVIDRRIKIAEQELLELEKCDFIDHVFVNDNFDTFYGEAVAFLKKNYNQFVY